MRTLNTIVLLAALGAASTAWAQDGVSSRNDDLVEAFTPLARDVAPHVVILVGNNRPQGYGVLIGQDQVLTSATVVEGFRSMTARGSGFSLEAQVLSQGDHHLALLQLEGSDGTLEALPWGSSADLRIGQFVVSCGVNPQPLAVGVVSATGRPVEPRPQGNMLMGLFAPEGNQGPQRRYAAVIQHDGPLQPAHFGAPLVDREGNLVGLNVDAPYRGSSHAVGVDEIAAALPGLRANARPRTGPAPRTPRTPAQPQTGGDRPWLGVRADVAPEPRLRGTPFAFGLVVLAVEGPAVEAGLEVDDVIVALEGEPFESFDAFAGLLRSLAPGDELRLTVLRGRGFREVRVTLGAH